ncbi:urease accessory protein UreE [Fulvimarina sp. 2208YS6-2-32]|uniref:Urease accessory protein UreE n=1 Tax=Fulvimarina uroteuthidis TaxID=3098149 RepID=A0ABU5I1R4_9HYPH|nr:urease accessory protein UreE [Fulvimarina sp. 2208YS6-2-32]MDY8109030.1 urease accessory protein UreE [Fulvimarina sp. 2208YS6-2-32]
MIRASQIAARPYEAADTITLDETARHRRRMVLTSDGGLSFLLDLPAARLLRHGEGLLLDDGRVIEVRAAPEALFAVSGENPRHLHALAWQIGNRHLAAQIEDGRILIRRDHVIEAMLTGLGATVTPVDEPFDPEGGAYGDSHDESHGHHHHGAHTGDHAHAHAHGDAHGHSHHGEAPDMPQSAAAAPASHSIKAG